MALIFESQSADVFIILDGELRFVGVFDDWRQWQIGDLGPRRRRNSRRAVHRLLHRRTRFGPQMSAGNCDPRRGWSCAVDPQLALQDDRGGESDIGDTRAE